jgi:flavin reductase (DIM6/NTAB) family NADH-FMN oxidoreductase RutF
MHDQKKLRECFGLFATGVIIACARKKNFLTENFFAEKILENKIFSEFSPSFTASKIKILESLKSSSLAKSFYEKLKKIFADEFFGMTINSFTSISLSPHLLMFCIDNKSSNLQLFKKNLYFSLNILSQDQQALAAAFATPKNSKKWSVEPYSFSKKGNPIFHNSLGFFECKKHRVIKAGDHHIIIGEILDFGKIKEKEPLLYYRGKYAALRN